MIVGTAGHIDHGKSSLVAALTGHRMDRLAEEQERGITIDLGFAPFPLDDGRMAGVVDVPGHEDFIRTMVAGASGVDLALLVVAADEGIMPQTLEHLLVLEQLGVPAGIPVLTKIDLVEPEWLDLVVADLAERLALSRVPFERPAAVSVRSGDGLADLRRRLLMRLASIPARPRDDLFRLPIDRAFSVDGIGTIITGTCWSGATSVGETIRILPSGRDARVRSIESHGSAAAVKPGSRTAIGLAGLERAEIHRGDIAVSADAPWIVSRVLDVRVELASTAARPLRRRQRVRIHLGTGEWIGWISPRAAVAAGGSGVARLTVEQAIVARGGDRFVLRSFSPVSTIGGGEVLDPAPPLRGAAWLEQLTEPDLARRLGALVLRRRHGVAARALPVLVGLSPAECAAAAQADGALVRVGDHWIGGDSIASLAARVATIVSDYHGANAAEPGMPGETVRQALRVPAWLANAALALAVERRTLLADGALVRLPGFRISGAGSAGEIERVAGLVEAAGLTPPTTDELVAQLKRPDARTSLRLAAAAGLIEAVERERYFGRAALNRFVDALVELGSEGEITVGMVRDRLSLSRKYLIPLLEWADAAGVTMRSGDVRLLRPASRRPPRFEASGPAARVPAAEAAPE